MGFNSAISGLSAANKDLSVVGNNIANANTTGFKSARADFSDVYQSTSGANGRLTALGSGVATARVSQSFTQGGVSLTGNNLDVSIDGAGFFILNNAGKSEYTRAGLLALNSDGVLINNKGSSLQGYQANNAGGLASNLSDLSVGSNTLAANQTSQVAASLNLDSRELAPIDPIFNSEKPNSYNYTTSTSVFDSLGNAHTLNTYFAKTSTANQWKLYTKIDGVNVATPIDGSQDPSSYALHFNQDGSLDKTNSTPVTITGWTPLNNQGVPNAATSNGFTLDFSNLTQTSSHFSIHKIIQNGFSSGQLNGIQISDEGAISAHYSNGQDKLVGEIALANFSNLQGLQSIGDTHWVETKSSGAALIGKPINAGLGSLRSGALESSNVDLSNQLVSLIIAQRNFQANAKSIQTEDAISQAIINIH